MQHTGSVKAAECRRLLWHAGDYIFYDHFGEFQPSLDAWLDILRQVESATADYDNANTYADIADLKMQVAEALTAPRDNDPFERIWVSRCHIGITLLSYNTTDYCMIVTKTCPSTLR